MTLVSVCDRVEIYTSISFYSTVQSTVSPCSPLLRVWSVRDTPAPSRARACCPTSAQACLPTALNLAHTCCVLTHAMDRLLLGRHKAQAAVWPLPPVDETLHPISHRLSTHFSLLPEIGTARAYTLGARERIQLQLRRWRQHPTFGIIENKLLAHSLIRSIVSAHTSWQVRQAPILYGAFATKALGVWPKYERAELIRALQGRHDFVLKSATNGGGADVLIMTQDRWQREGWRQSNVTAYAERFLAGRQYSEWGQRYEHRAVLLQANVLQETSKLPTPSIMSPSTRSLAFEVKVNVAFGQLGSARLLLMPKAEAAHLALSFCDAGKVICSSLRCSGGGGRDLCDSYCRRAVRMLSNVAPSLEELARNLTAVLAADWFRLDVFVMEDGVGGKVDLIVNELSYPSHFEQNASVCCSFERLTNVYSRKAYELADGGDILRGLMSLAGLDSSLHRRAFLQRPDFLTLQHASEEVYDSQLWQWSPKNAKKFEHRSTIVHRVSEKNSKLNSTSKSRAAAWVPRDWPTPVLRPSGCVDGVADPIRSFDECKAAAGHNSIGARGIHSGRNFSTKFQFGCSKCGPDCSSKDVNILFFNAYEALGEPHVLNPKHQSVCRSSHARVSSLMKAKH